MSTRHAAGVGVVLVLVLGSCACTSASDPPAARPPPARTEAELPPPAQTKAEPAPARSDCELLAGASRERVKLGLNSAATIASGLKVHFVGSSQDHYEDGSFEVLAELRFVWGEETAVDIVSALAPTSPSSFRPILDHCWRLVELGDEGVVVELAASAGPTLASCVEPKPPLPPVFDSYYEVAEDVPFTATLRYDAAAHQWAIEPRPKILLHHATRIEWSNLTVIGRQGLGRAQGEDVQVTFHFESSEVTKSRHGRQWFSEHVATIDSACLPREG